METEKQTVHGTVAAVVFRNEENGYSVIKLDREDGEQFTAVGTIPDAFPGEAFALTGEWMSHHTYGQQFRADAFERAAPTGADAIFRYLASGVIKGIGPGRAREIVNKFGENALEIIEAAPEKLASVKGISTTAAKEMSKELRRTAGVRKLIESLTEHNISPLTAMRLYRTLGEDALDYVTENPYIMAESTYGTQFFEADRMAMEMGFEPDCAERLEAALVFEMRHNLGNGHVFIPTDKLIAAAAQLIDTDSQSLSDVLDMISGDGELVRETLAGRDVCYLREMRDAEEYVAGRLTVMGKYGSDKKAVDVDSLLLDVERTLGLKYAEGQLEAVRIAATRRVMVLTGGPGTGKTTSLRGILELFDNMRLKTLLCAPTGRAAKRMSELTGRDGAMTIHRALGAGMGDEGELVFERDAENPLKIDAVVVDEASMLDLPLAHALMCALPLDCRLVLVGDANQLPSVGPGNVFSDIVKSGAVPVVQLTEIFRQARESAIIRAAHSVNNGEMPDLSQRDSDMFFLKRSGTEAISDTIAELVSQRLPTNMGIPAAQIQVLTPTRKNTAGTTALNTRLQAVLNPPGARREKQHGSHLFREGDKVMQIRNDYDIIWRDLSGAAGAGVYNGDLGVIAAIDFSAEMMTVDFEDKTVEYMFEQLSDLELAYAVTVHKSQGSEYRAVVLALPSGASRLAVRAVLYTAITRARELLIIVGESGVFEAMVANDKRSARYSGLLTRLRLGAEL